MKRMRTFLATALTVGLAGLLAPLLSPSPANAAQSDCTTTVFCLWMDINFSGPVLYIHGPSSNLSYIGANDKISSAYNRSSATWCLYEHANYGGRRLVFPPNSQIHDFRNYGWNDIASSVKLC
ncbi:peptidase inhibitor family I36 protein [Micromonospora sp. NPDC048830]|uniref:peptidase inhibitor family I36 protein n=1 Tax=Micromonospora sp. NPDC048830 TaxID=3364257 RepID=UPI00371CE28F